MRIMAKIKSKKVREVLNLLNRWKEQQEKYIAVLEKESGIHYDPISGASDTDYSEGKVEAYKEAIALVEEELT